MSIYFSTAFDVNSLKQHLLSCSVKDVLSCYMISLLSSLFQILTQSKSDNACVLYLNSFIRSNLSLSLYQFFSFMYQYKNMEAYNSVFSFSTFYHYTIYV